MNEQILKPEIIAEVNKYIAVVQLTSDEHYKKDLQILWEKGLQAKYSYEIGNRWIKVIVTTNQRSVFCFIDPANGDLYKADSWKKPAKGVRGNIFNEKKPVRGGEFYRQL